MPDVSQSLRSMLLSDASLVGLVVDRVIPDQLAQSETLPAITYRVISSRHEHTINGPKAGARWTRFTVECFADSRQGADTLAETMRLSGILDWTGDAHGVEVLSVEIDSGATHFAEQNTEGSHELRYITSYDFEILHREAV